MTTRTSHHPDDVAIEISEYEPDATLLTHPALVTPDATVPGRVRVSNLASSIVEEIVADRVPTKIVTEAVQREVENAGYQITGYRGMTVDLDPDDGEECIELDVQLTGTRR